MDSGNLLETCVVEICSVLDTCLLKVSQCPLTVKAFSVALT